MRLLTSLGSLCLAFAGAAAHAQSEKQPISVAERKNVAPVVFARMRTTIGQNDIIGTRQEGRFCMAKGTFALTSKTWEAMRIGAGRAFRNELARAGYPKQPGTESTTSAFDDQTRTPVLTDFEVGAVVTRASATLCVNGREVKGGVHVEAKWELYSKQARKVVFEVVTDGSYQTFTPEVIAFHDWFDRAFAVAVRSLLAEPKFADILSGLVELPAAQVAVGPAIILAAAPLQGGVAQNATLLRASVVTVHSGKATGSGFFVSPEGHLLTAAHVVGDVKFVKVQLATGRELVGEVLSVDHRRDVALLKTEAIGAPPLAIRLTEPNIGEELYAIGSPLGQTFSGSMTRGILSGHRTLDDQRYLQSDVAVLPGNSGGPLLDVAGKVVGISKGGVVSGTGNLNLFVPIGDAITKLSLQVKE
jgi:serine protease Do